MTDRPIRALLNATSIRAPRAGAANYVLSLAGALAAMPEDVTLELLVQRRDLEDVRELAPDARIETTGVVLRPLRLAWEHLVLPRRIHRIAPDLVHGPHYTLPGRLRCPSVVTFHDPTFFTMPEVHERAKVAYFTRMARAGIRRATRVIAVSEYARRGAIEHGGADPDHVDVTPLGVDGARFRPAAERELAEDERERAALGARGPYVLWVGAIEPR
jgi:glycosyltransferase involved in cell wall biosynthesis